jgi:hypothetical protein
MPMMNPINPGESVHFDMFSLERKSRRGGLRLIYVLTVMPALLVLVNLLAAFLGHEFVVIPEAANLFGVLPVQSVSSSAPGDLALPTHLDIARSSSTLYNYDNITTASKQVTLLPEVTPTLTKNEALVIKKGNWGSQTAETIGLRPTGDYNHVAERMDHWMKIDDPSGLAPVLQIVTHRDMLLGCYSFEEYLSPRFHTLIVLPKNFALELEVDKLVKKATREQTAGVHLFVPAGKYAGQLMALLAGKQFYETELKPMGYNIEFLNQVNCDVHQLPAGHRHFLSMEEVTLKLMKDFRLAKQYRHRGNYLERNYDDKGNVPGYIGSIPRNRMKILAMNTILFERIPDLQSVANFHGKDVFKWWLRGRRGWKRRPKDLKAKGLPWLYDTSTFYENHIMMFDIQVLELTKNSFLDLEEEIFLIAGNTDMSMFGPWGNITALRNNDVALHINFGTFLSEFRFPSGVNLDMIKRMNLELVAHVRNPMKRDADARLITELMGQESTKSNKPFFIGAHFNNITWLPHGFSNGESLAKQENQDILRQIFLFFGYVSRDVHGGVGQDVLRYELKLTDRKHVIFKLFPAEEIQTERWSPILTFRAIESNNFILCICNSENEKCDHTRKAELTAHDRRFEIPKSAVIEKLQFDNWEKWGY